MIAGDFKHGTDHRGRQVAGEALHEVHLGRRADLRHAIARDLPHFWLQLRQHARREARDYHAPQRAVPGRVHAQQLVARHVENIVGKIVHHDKAAFGREGFEIPRHLQHIRMPAEHPVAVAGGVFLPVHRVVLTQPGELRVRNTVCIVVGIVDVDVHGYSTITGGLGTPISAQRAR